MAKDFNCFKAVNSDPSSPFHTLSCTFDISNTSDISDMSAWHSNDIANRSLARGRGHDNVHDDMNVHSYDQQFSYMINSLS